MITVEQAHEMGAKGGPADEHERLLFEAWMAGHCWAIQGDWDGTTYVHESERNLRQVHLGAIVLRWKTIVFPTRTTVWRSTEPASIEAALASIRASTRMP